MKKVLIIFVLILSLSLVLAHNPRIVFDKSLNFDSPIVIADMCKAG